MSVLVGRKAGLIPNQFSNNYSFIQQYERQ